MGSARASPEALVVSLHEEPDLPPDKEAPGAAENLVLSRTGAVQRIPTRFKRISQEKQLRDELRGYREGENEHAEHEAWERKFPEAMWSEMSHQTNV